MIIRTGLSGLCLCLLVGGAGGAQTLNPPSAGAALGAFALPDEGGTRLLLIPKLAQPELLKVALCSSGHRVPVQFERLQAGREGANGRQTPYNFDNLDGSVFSILTGKVDPDGICFLASAPLLARTTVLSITAPVGAGACVDRNRFATLRDRPVTNCWPIARMAPGKQVALLQFARRGKDALASLVFVDGARTIFADYPAEFRGEGEDLWRADDGGVLSPMSFQIVCALQREGWYALGIAWSGPEGQSLSLWTSDGSERFTEVIKDYWYQAPI